MHIWSPVREGLSMTSGLPDHSPKHSPENALLWPVASSILPSALPDSSLTGVRHSLLELNSSSQGSSHLPPHPSALPSFSRGEGALRCLYKYKAAIVAQGLTTEMAQAPGPRKHPDLTSDAAADPVRRGFFSIYISGSYSARCPRFPTSSCFSLFLLCVYFLCLHTLFFFQGTPTQTCHLVPLEIKCGVCRGSWGVGGESLGAQAAAYRKVLSPSCGEERGGPRKSPRQATHLISSFWLVSFTWLLGTVNSDRWGSPEIFIPWVIYNLARLDKPWRKYTEVDTYIQADL